MKSVAIFIIFLYCFSIASCKEENKEVRTELKDEYVELNVPKGFPEPTIPEDNQLTSKKIALGKKLFFDPILSLDSSISCGSCHFQKYAFSDSVAISRGVHGQNGNRNAPALFNLAWRTAFFHDGGVPTIEMQVIAPIQTEEEMHLNILDAAERLKEHSEYPALIADAFDGREPDAFTITRAIASFERTLISGDSKFDKYYYQNDKSAMNESELRGMQLFNSEKLKCNDCHSGFNFTNEAIVNNGLHANYATDAGRMRISLDKSDEGKFKVASLRNIELTAPYMHDGSLSTIDEVIDHYASGGSDHFNKSPLIQGFELEEGERNDLIAFLNALTDKTFITNKEFYP